MRTSCSPSDRVFHHQRETTLTNTKGVYYWNKQNPRRLRIEDSVDLDVPSSVLLDTEITS